MARFRTYVSSSYAKTVQFFVEADDRVAAREIVEQAITGVDIADAETDGLKAVSVSNVEWESDFIGDLELIEEAES